MRDRTYGRATMRPALTLSASDREEQRYVPALDGLRALAVSAVVLYHLDSEWAPGGLLGVTVFFVLSGYLITDILHRQWTASSRINLGDFWIRRARRLLPALLAMLTGVALWLVVFAPSRLSALSGQWIAALLYYSNWYLLLHHVSYFAQFGPPSPFDHLWSLAVEEQFYLVWPLLFVFSLFFIKRRWMLVSLILVYALSSALWMAVLYQPGLDPSRVYYGTDTRAFSLLIGAAFALVWPLKGQAKATGSPARRIPPLLLDIGGSAAVIGLFLCFLLIGQYTPVLYRGGMVVVSLMAALLVVALVHPATHLAAVFAWKPLRWVGVRSYGIYLWHYPVIVLTSPTNTAGDVSIARDLVQVVVSVGLAALSWRYIEQPIRKGALGRAWRRLSVGLRRLSPRLPAMTVTVTMVCLILTGLLFAGSRVPSATASSAFPALGLSDTPVQKMIRSENTSPHQKIRVATSTVPGNEVTAIGDSIMIDAEPFLQHLLPGIIVNGVVGRQMYTLQSVLTQLRKEHELRSHLIIELGTNGPFQENVLVATLRSLKGVKGIVLVNTRVDRPWQTIVNQALRQTADQVPHTVLVNWYAASAGKSALFYPDGVHLNPTGAAYFAGLLVHAIEHP